MKFITVDQDGRSIRVLHPIECLKSRIDYLVELYPKKWGPYSKKFDVEQLRVIAALEIVERYFRDGFKDNVTDSRKRIMSEIAGLCRYGNSSICRKLLRGYQLSLADAIPNDLVDERFRGNQYQGLLDLYSSLTGSHN